MKKQTAKLLILFAIFKNSTFGTIRKSIGDDVAYQLGGQNIIRKKPVSVNDANTTKQQARRTALKRLVNVYRHIQSVVKAGFVQRLAKHSAYNAFMHENLKNAVILAGANATINYPALKVAKGSMPAISLGASPTISGNTLSVTLNNVSDNNLITDNDKQVIVVLSDDNPDRFVTAEFPATATGSHDIDVSNFDSGVDLRVYLFAKSSDGQKTSDSSFVGTVTN